MKKLDRFFNNLPKKVIFCKICVISNQRPRITFKDGVCSACIHAENKKKINYKDKKEKLSSFLKKFKKKNEWDVIVPCSGGKDSSRVAHILKNDFGMNPLCVTFAPNKYTSIGLENFEQFVGSGFSVLNFFFNGELYRKLSRIAFEELGDNFTPFVFGQMAYGFHIAQKFNINLIFWGENAELEYGGDTNVTINDRIKTSMSNEIYWKGSSVRELINVGLKKYPEILKDEDINEADLKFLEHPINADEVETAWMSTYMDWKPQDNYYYCVKNTGFKPNKLISEGTFSRYASLDDKLDWLHYYMMFVKLGIGRATSDACREIREKLITRDEACLLVNRYDGKYTKNFFDLTLDYLGLDEEKLLKIVNSYRADHIWKKVGNEYKLKHNVSGTGVED